MTEENRFEARRVSPQDWHVVDLKHSVEFCVCATFEGEADTAEARAKTTAGALNAVDILMKHMQGLN